MRINEGILLIGAAAGAILGLYADTFHTNPTILDPISIMRQEEEKGECFVVEKSTRENAIEVIPLVLEQIDFQSDPELEDWYGTDRKLTDFEWEAMSQMIMAEARGESFEVQYYIACTVLNRVDNPIFPNTVTGVIYQTQPVQFYGAWDKTQYDPTDSVLEAIQTALEENRTPSDLFYFTSEGWLSGTEPWMQVGGMWFSRQGD